MSKRTSKQARSLPGLCTLAMAAGVASAALAQPTGAPSAGADRGSETWADQQRSQSWATAKLARSSRRHEWVSLHLGDRTLRAFVTYPTGVRNAPVVLVLHEVFGLTDSTLNTADEVSAMGAITIAPDMLSALAPDGRGTSGFPATRMAGDFITLLPNEMVDAEINAWLSYGGRLPRFDGKIGIVGLSWGGGAAFRYASGTDVDPRLKSIFVFYDVGPPAVTQGQARFRSDAPPVPVTAIQVPVYGFYPSEDERVMQSLAATRSAMAAAGKRFEPVIYEGANHAFMRVGEDPSNPNPADRAAVAKSLDRLRTVITGW